MKKKYLIITLVIMILVFFDQLTKYIIVNSFDVGNSMILINNFLKFLYIRNTGAAFGIMSGNTILFAIITLVLLYYIIIEVRKNNVNKISISSYTLIIAGAIGNLIDRIFRGYVIDFISFSLFKREMPIFNVADICITFGVILFIYNIIREGKNERINSRKRR